MVGVIQIGQLECKSLSQDLNNVYSQPKGGQGANQGVNKGNNQSKTKNWGDLNEFKKHKNDLGAGIQEGREIRIGYMSNEVSMFVITLDLMGNQRPLGDLYQDTVVI